MEEIILMKVFFCIVEVATLLICVFFGYKWVNNPQGNYEPWLFLAGLIFIAFEVFRRYGETFFKKDGKIASLIPWVKHRLNRPIIVPHQRQNWWHMGKTGDQKPTMQVVSYWYITNPTEYSVNILNVYIDNPRIFGHVLTKDVNSQYHGSYPVPPHATTDLHADFWIHPPIRKEGRKLKLDISFIDQFGQRRKIKNVMFESDKKKRPIPKSLQAEAIYQIEHGIEKKVAAVLKDEINRYKKYGRKSGELGSTYAIHNGRKIKSIYQDGWSSSKSGERQEIVTDPENSHVYSENGDILTSCYNEIINSAEKELFINSLLSRLNREKEYYCVSYIIVYVLFRIGRLNDGLVAAKFGLQNKQHKQSFFDKILKRKLKNELLEPHQRYGFSDALGMINGLLRYEHQSFTDIELDLLEEFIFNVKEHTFCIEEKINSIRSFRLNTNNKRT